MINRYLVNLIHFIVISAIVIVADLHILIVNHGRSNPYGQYYAHPHQYPETRYPLLNMHIFCLFEDLYITMIVPLSPTFCIPLKRCKLTSLATNMRCKHAMVVTDRTKAFIIHSEHLLTNNRVVNH